MIVPQKYLNQKRIEVKGKIDKGIIRVGDFNTLLFPIITTGR